MNTAITQRKILDRVAKLASNVTGVLRTADAASGMRFLFALAVTAPQVAHARNLTPADRRMHGRTVRFSIEGTDVILDGGDFSGAREMYCRRVYLAHPGAKLRPGATVVDLGANVGLFSVLAARRGCRVIAVDAQAGMLPESRRRLAKNGCEANVELVCGLVGAGVGVFATTDLVAARGSHHEAADESPPISLEPFLDARNVRSIDFLKVDIEGSEFALFRRYEPWMSRIRFAAMEVHAQYGACSDLTAVLAEAGLMTELRDEMLRPTMSLGNSASGYLYAWRPE